MTARAPEAFMRRLAVVALLVSIALGVVAAQQRVRGQVINRDGAPQQCQANFFLGGKHQYALTTDYNGYFVLTNPGHGTYRVEVVQGNRRHAFAAVVIDSNGIRPATLVVPW